MDVGRNIQEEREEKAEKHSADEFDVLLVFTLLLSLTFSYLTQLKLVIVTFVLFTHLLLSFVRFEVAFMRPLGLCLPSRLKNVLTCFSPFGTKQHTFSVLSHLCFNTANKQKQMLRGKVVCIFLMCQLRTK